MIEGGFEPPPSKRLEPYSSALDQLGHPIMYGADGISID